MFFSFSDGLHIKSKGVGAAALTYDPVTEEFQSPLRVRVGDAENHTAYQAELTGFELALANARKQALSTTNFFWFFTDNQSLIRDVTEPVRVKAGMSACLRIRNSLSKLLNAHRAARAAVIWCPAHQDIGGINAADAAAKEAVDLPQVIESLPTATAAKAMIKRQLTESKVIQPPRAILTRLLGTFNPKETYDALCKLSRPDATFITQIRAGHCPLNSYLFRFHAADSPNCNLCRQPETVDHLLTNCRKFVGLRRRLYGAATAAKVATNRTSLLTSPKLYPAIATFGRQSFRFYASRHRQRHRQHIPTTTPTTTTRTATAR